jgi:hypothetical protein
MPEQFAFRFSNLLPHHATTIYRQDFRYLRLPESDQLPVQPNGTRVICFAVDNSTPTCRRTFLHFMSNPTRPYMLLLEESSQQLVATPDDKGKLVV